MNKNFVEGFLEKCAQEGLSLNESEGLLKVADEMSGPFMLALHGGREALERRAGRHPALASLVTAGKGSLWALPGAMIGAPLGAARHLFRDEDDEATLLGDIGRGAGYGAVGLGLPMAGLGAAVGPFDPAMAQDILDIYG